VNPHEEGFNGTCQIQYGPIQIDPDLKKAVGLATADGYLQVRCEGTNLGNGNQFDMVKANHDAITFYDSRFDSVIACEQIRKELVIEPSTNDPLRLKIKSGGTEYHTKTTNQDDKDKMILFLDFMIRKKENLNESFSSLQHRGPLKTQLSGGTVDSAANTFHEPPSTPQQNTKQNLFKSNSMYQEMRPPAPARTQVEQNDAGGRSFMFESHHQADLGQSLLYEATPIEKYYRPPPPTTPPPPTLNRYQSDTNPQREHFAELNASVAVNELMMNGKPIQIKERPKNIPGVKDSNYYQVPQPSQIQPNERVMSGESHRNSVNPIDLEISGIRPHRIVESRNSVVGPTDFGYFERTHKVEESQLRESLYHPIPLQEYSTKANFGGAANEQTLMHQSILLNHPKERTVTRVVEHKVVRLPQPSQANEIHTQFRESNHMHHQKPVSDLSQYEIQRLNAEIGLLNLRLGEAEKNRGHLNELQQENQRQRSALAKLKADNGRTDLNR